MKSSNRERPDMGGGKYLCINKPHKHKKETSW